jgi:hypothetical protein
MSNGAAMKGSLHFFGKVVLVTLSLREIGEKSD